MNWSQLTTHAPWLSFFIGDKGALLEEDELFFNALKIAIQLGRTHQYNDYISGFSAFKMWIGELRKHSGSVGNDFFPHHEVNLTLFNGLVDSRMSALGFLTAMDRRVRMRNYNLIIANYKKGVGLLSDLQSNVLPSFKAGPQDWTVNILEKQSQVLKEVLRIEEETIELIEDELSYRT